MKVITKEVDFWDFCRHHVNCWYDANDGAFYFQKDSLFLVDGLFLREITKVVYPTDSPTDSLMSALERSFSKRELRHLPYSDKPIKTKVPDWSNLHAI